MVRELDCWSEAGSGGPFFFIARIFFFPFFSFLSLIFPPFSSPSCLLDAIFPLGLFSGEGCLVLCVLQAGHCLVGEFWPLLILSPLPGINENSPGEVGGILVRGVSLRTDWLGFGQGSRLKGLLAKHPKNLASLSKSCLIGCWWYG